MSSVSEEEISKEISEYLTQKWGLPHVRALRVAKDQARYIQLINSISGKNLNKEMIGEIFEICQDCAEMSEEGRSVGTSFIIGNYKNIKNLLPEPKGISLEENCSVGIRKVVSNLLGVVDGQLMTFVVDEKGNNICVRKLGQLKLQYHPPPIVPLKYELFSYITKKTHSIALVVPKNQVKVKIFKNGELVEDVLKTKRTGKEWVYRSYPQITQALEKLAHDLGLISSNLQRLVAVFTEMAAQRIGTLAFIGDHETVIGMADHPNITIKPFELSEVSDDEIVNFAKEDGAIILDSRCTFLRITDPVRPTAVKDAISACTGEKLGTKHKTAKTVSMKTKALCIAVSEAGTITFYRDGNIILKL